MGAPKGHPTLFKEKQVDEEMIIFLYEKGNSASRISKLMNCSLNLILKRLRKNNIKLFHERKPCELPTGYL